MCTNIVFKSIIYIDSVTTKTYFFLHEILLFIYSNRLKEPFFCNTNPVSYSMKRFLVYDIRTHIWYYNLWDQI